MIAATAGTQTVLAQQNNTDSLRMEKLQEVVVRGVKAQKGAPFAVENFQTSRKREKNCLSYSRKRRECCRGVKTDWAQERHICVSEVQAVRASTLLWTVCLSTRPKTNACSGLT